MEKTKFQIYIENANLDLKDHQIKGVEWGISRENGIYYNDKLVKGGLIADDMGLGKTVQMIGIILSSEKILKTLIVVPRALIDQWYTFIKKTTDLNIKKYHTLNKLTYDELEKSDIIVTTYGMILNKNSISNIYFEKIKWDRIVFDEAHHLKNSKTKIFKSAKKINANIRWLITGTPIQNSKKDFYSLCDQIGVPNKFYSDEDNLKFIAKNMIIKRKKNEVNIYLPNLYQETINVKWSNSSEKILAQEIHSKFKFTNIDYISKFNLQNDFGESTLARLMRARQMCIYPKMLDKKLKEIYKINKYRDNNKLNIKQLLDTSVKSSSKIDCVINKIKELKDNQNKKNCLLSF